MTVTLRADRPQIETTGSVVNAAGQPLIGATVRLHWSGGGRENLGRTDPSGRFQTTYPAGSPPPDTVKVRMEGYIDLTAPWPGADGNGELPPLRMAKARSLRIRALDPQGQSISIDGLSAQDSAARTFRASSLDGPGVLGGLPAEALTVEARIGGRKYRTEVSADANSADLQVPSHGTLRIELGSLAGPVYDPRAARYVTLVAAEDTNVRLRLRVDQPSEWRLLPGRYLVEAEDTWLDVSAGRITTWQH